LGRYWPLVGPQITLYIPREELFIGINKITILELQRIPENGIVKFSNRAKLDGK
jgi:beta-galactosidase